MVAAVVLGALETGAEEVEGAGADERGAVDAVEGAPAPASDGGEEAHADAARQAAAARTARAGVPARAARPSVSFPGGPLSVCAAGAAARLRPA